MSKKDLKSMFDIQVGTKLEMDELENHNDTMNANIVLAITHLSKLLPKLTLQSFGKAKVRREDLIETMSKVYFQIMLLSNACNFEVPEEDELEMFEKSLPPEVKFDAVLTIMGMIGALVDAAQVIWVDLDTPIWAEAEIPEAFEDDIFTVVCGIKTLGEKYNFTLDDVLANVS
jgi:hypothetical protein